MSSSKLNNAINVTPLADVMLVLLTIFMVVTPLLTPDVPVDVPEADHPTTHPGGEETLVLSMKGDGSLFLNRDPMARAALPQRLKRRLENRSERTLYVKADRSLDYGGVLELLDVCRRAGASEVALMTKEKREPSPM